MKIPTNFNARSHPTFLLCVFFALPSPAPLAAADSSTTGAEKPNVLLVMTDDQGWGDIHSHQNPDIDTPNLDSLANSGARFNHFYVSPVCAPTRAALLTGRWHPRTGVSGVTRTAETMRSDELTMAEIFRRSGYRTGAFGKWHNGAHWPHDPNGQGFDEFLGFCAGHWDLYFDSPLTHNQQPTHGDGFLIDHLTDKAIAFIQADSEQPWLCYVPYNTPHTPWQVPDRYWEKYSARDMSPTTACAYAMVENIDDNLGRLLAAIETAGQTDNTIVLFLTDNGANTDRWDGNMRGQKGSLHEGGSRVPLFIRFPGQIKPSTTIKTLAAHIDLLPTLMEFAGITLSGSDGVPQKPLDGKSLATILRTGHDDQLANRTLFNHWAGRGSVRTPHWRLVKDRARQTSWQLFDMLTDPSETTNVSAQFPEIASSLEKQYMAWWADVSAAGFEPIPTEVGHPEAPMVRLLGHEALLDGDGISYNGPNGWANDWIDNWTSPDAIARWPLKVVEGGQYRVSLQLACDESAKGTEIILTAGDAELRYIIDVAHQTKKIPTRDLIERKETTPQTWLIQPVGQLTLSPGILDLKLRRSTAGPTIQIKSVILQQE